MRVHVGERKLMDLESIESVTKVALPDAVWNALAKLTKLEILEIECYIQEAIKLAKSEQSDQSE